MHLIPPFAMYFTVEDALELDLTDRARADLKVENDTARPFMNCADRLVFTLWQKLSDETQVCLIEAHDKAYEYESWPR